MKQTALNLLHGAGMFAPFRLLNRHKLLILMYHRFGNAGDASFTTASDFENQLRYLRQYYEVLPLLTVAQQLARGEELPRRAAAITIDDGYRDSYRVAVPLLRKYQMPATIFVVTDFVDQKIWLWTDKPRLLTLKTDARVVELRIGEKMLTLELNGRRSRIEAAARINTQLKKLRDHEKEAAIERLSSSLGVNIPEAPTQEFEALTWEELREMEGFGIEIGSHTVSHPILTQVDMHRVRNELRDSKLRLEKVLGHEVPLFCYPNGISSDQIRDEVRLAGYTGAVSATPGLNDRSAEKFDLRRISAEQDLPHFAQSTSGFEDFKSGVRSLLTTK